MTDFYLLSILVTTFFAQIIIGVPIAFAIGLSSFFSLLVLFPPATAALIVAQKMLTSLDNFTLLAIPFFILAGNIMNRGGISLRLINLAEVLTGRLPGSLLHCNAFANLLFGSISGSAVSAVAAVGGTLAPVQKQKGYPPELGAAVNICSGPIGLLVPPSNILILFSLVSGGTSIAALFIAGYFPGIIMLLAISLVTVFFSRRGSKFRVVPSSDGQDLTWKQKGLVIFRALPSLFLVVVVIGGILAGAFTATEASAVAVLYSLLLAIIYKEINLDNFFAVFSEAVSVSAIVLFLIASSSAMAWVLSVANVPEHAVNLFKPILNDPWLVILMFNLILLVAGTFLDMTPAVLIFTPVFLPIANEIGMHPIHFGIMMIFNLCIGICTPPVGSSLFVGSSISGVSIEKVIRRILPYYGVMILALLLVSFLPALSLWLPEVLGVLK